MTHFKQLEERLVRTFMSGWKRRGSSLLQVGLHSCLSPDFFWDAGFDVCAVDENLHALNYALDASGPRVEYRLGKMDCLPFDDDSFDYAFFTCYASPDYKLMKADGKDLQLETLENKESEIESLSLEKIKELDSKNENSILGMNIKRIKSIQDVRENTSNILDGMPSFLENSSLESLFGQSLFGKNYFGKNLFGQNFFGKNPNDKNHEDKNTTDKDYADKNLADKNLVEKANIFSETCRVAQKGVIILCKNSFSMHEVPVLGNKINPWGLWKIAKQTFPQGKVQIMSSLTLPHFVQKRFNIVSLPSNPLLLGDLLGVCIDFNASAVTGLGVLSKAVQEKKRTEEPVVNRSNMRNK